MSMDIKYGYLHWLDNGNAFMSEAILSWPDPDYEKVVGKPQEASWWVGDADQGYYPFATEADARGWLARPSKSEYFCYLTGVLRYDHKS